MGGKIDKAVAFEEVLVLSSFMCKASQVCFGLVLNQLLLQRGVCVFSCGGAHQHGLGSTGTSK